MKAWMPGFTSRWKTRVHEWLEVHAHSSVRAQLRLRECGGGFVFVIEGGKVRSPAGNRAPSAIRNGCLRVAGEQGWCSGPVRAAEMAACEIGGALGVGLKLLLAVVLVVRLAGPY